MVNNLVFRWPKPLCFMVLGAHGRWWSPKIFGWNVFGILWEMILCEDLRYFFHSLVAKNNSHPKKYISASCSNVYQE